jgi:hypothetical protein
MAGTAKQWSGAPHPVTPVAMSDEYQLLNVDVTPIESLLDEPSLRRLSLSWPAQI